MDQSEVAITTEAPDSTLASELLRHYEELANAFPAASISSGPSPLPPKSCGRPTDHSSWLGSTTVPSRAAPCANWTRRPAR